MSAAEPGRRVLVVGAQGIIGRAVLARCITFADTEEMFRQFRQLAQARLIPPLG